MYNDYYEFSLMPLPYSYSALEPHIDAKTMELHHDKHLKTYVDNLNAILKNFPAYQDWSLEKLVRDYMQLPMEIQQGVRNNAGGVFNHNFYFANLTNKNTRLDEELSGAIDRTFGSFDSFKEGFKKAALGVFGSGYAFLVLDANSQLKITTTPNQDNPLTQNMFPIMEIDVWEHAYYLKHYNVRADYIDDWFRVVDLDMASRNYKSIMDLQKGTHCRM